MKIKIFILIDWGGGSGDCTSKENDNFIRTVQKSKTRKQINNGIKAGVAT